MNIRGIFCTALAISFAIAVISFQTGTCSNSSQHHEVTLLAMQAEKASFIRSSLEKNFDIAVRNALEKCIMLGITEQWEAQQFVNSELEKALGKIDEATEEAEFENIDREFLEENSKVFVQSVNGIVIVEYFFTGGLLKNHRRRARIKVGKAETCFEIRRGYTAVVIG